LAFGQQSSANYSAVSRLERPAREKLPRVAGEAEALFALKLVIENGQDAAMDVAG
jgi:hypothetical protein